MELTNKEQDIVIQYSLLATILDEWFTFAEPILVKTYLSRVSGRRDKRKAEQEFRKEIAKHKKWLRGTGNLIEHSYPDNAQEAIDRVHAFISKVTVEN